MRTPAVLTTEADESERGLRVWYADTGPFNRPRASVLLLLRTPVLADGSARAAILSELAAQLLSDALSISLAPCALAGLGWTVGTHPAGMLLQASGFSQNVPKLSLELAKGLAGFEPDPERFGVMREVLSRALRNRDQERPLWHAQYALGQHLTTPSTHYEDALRFILDDDECTPAALAEHVKEIVSANFAELLVHGNLLPAHALELGAEWRSILSAAHPGGTALPPDCAPLPVTTLLPTASEAAGADGEGARLRGVAANAEEVNSAIEIHLQLGEPELEDEALLLTLAQLASKDAFNVLRTQRQLGYVVQCGVRSIGRSRGISVLIQSAVKPPVDLDAEIESWLSQFHTDVLPALTPAAFDEYKEAVALTLDEPPKMLSHEAGVIWGEIIEGTHRWQHDEQLAAAVRRLTLAELLRFVDEHIVAGAPSRRKISSQWYSQADDRKERERG